MSLEFKLNKLPGKSIILSTRSLDESREMIHVSTGSERREVCTEQLMTLKNMLSKLGLVGHVELPQYSHKDRPYLNFEDIDDYVILDALEDLLGPRVSYYDYDDEFYYPDGPRISFPYTLSEPFSSNTISYIYIRLYPVSATVSIYFRQEVVPQ